MVRPLCSFVVAAIILSPARAEDAALKRLTIKVGSTQREALVHIPGSARKTPAPLVFVFHGHKGTMRDAADSFGCHKHWPEAICVYPQGLPTATRSDPKGKYPGWQNALGTQGDRDLMLFDRLLVHLKKHYKVDEKRVFAAGFSNGGNFTYLLWDARGDVLAAVSPSAGSYPKLKDLQPKPCLHIVGKKDGHANHLDRVIETLCKVNGCTTAGKA
jgi:polyhydroxybutyrate depolymerase